MKHVYKFFLFALLIFILQIPYTAYAEQIPISSTAVTSSNDLICPFKDVIEWKYKKMNNKWYKRQFNLTTQKWIGEWQLVD